MEKESRQVRRAKERQKLKKGGLVSTHELYYIPMKRKSRAGVVYEYYKKVVDKIGLRNKKNDEPRIKNIINKGESKC